jgi:hypothetical protein
MSSFEVIFRVPPNHQLEQVRSRSRGGIMRAVYLDHEEYDASGCLVARYHCFEEVNRTGRRSGWSKYDRQGCLLYASNELPRPVE